MAPCQNAVYLGFASWHCAIHQKINKLLFCFSENYLYLIAVNQKNKFIG
jgi:hypothetical protein